LLRLLVITSLTLAVSARADEPTLGLLLKTLAYDDTLSTRVGGKTLHVVALGVPCASLPALSVAGREVRCTPATTLDGAVNAALAEPSVLLLANDAATPLAATIALAANLTVLSATRLEPTSESLLSLAKGKVHVGALALKRLSAKFPANILRTLSLVQAPTMPPALPEFAFPPRPPADGTVPWPKGEKGAEAVVVLRVGVLATGKVASLEVLKGAPAFIALAVPAVRDWVWEPARLDDAPIAASIVFRVLFRSG
jgi:TonB family protein